jgi:hypothetical protein
VIRAEIGGATMKTRKMPVRTAIHDAVTISLEHLESAKLASFLAAQPVAGNV